MGGGAALRVGGRLERVDADALHGVDEALAGGGALFTVGVEHGFDDVSHFFGGGFPLSEGGWGRERFWDVNVDETDKEVVVRAEAPGFEPGEFDVDVRGDMLTLEVTNGLDRGVRVIAGRSALDVEGVGELQFIDGRPRLGAVGGRLLYLNGVHAALAVQLAAPMLMTMLIVDLALGCIGKAMPQMNVMAMGLSIRSILGMIVLIAGLALTTRVIQSTHIRWGEVAAERWSAPQGR